jgi:hypothetical protein
VLAKLETLRTLLAGTINTSDANVLATLQQLQTRLAAIETKLNGTLLTQLTGSNAKLIKSHLGLSITNASFNVGDTSGSNVNTVAVLDVSMYKEKLIFIQNKGAAACKLWSVGVYAGTGTMSGTTRLSLNTNSNNRWSIPAGATLLLTKDDIKELGLPVIGLAIVFYDPDNTFSTTIDVLFMGGKL